MVNSVSIDLQEGVTDDGIRALGSVPGLKTLVLDSKCCCVCIFL